MSEDRTVDPRDWEQDEARFEEEEAVAFAAADAASEAEIGRVETPPAPVTFAVPEHQTVPALPSTVGFVITHHGHPCWVGDPDKTDSPTFRVYDSAAQARRALYHIARATRFHTGEASGFAVSRVRVSVERLGPEVVIRFRGKGYDD